MSKGFPVITKSHFSHDDVNYVMAFDNGQTVTCYGYSLNENSHQILVDKCENYYLNHHAISAYEIHVRSDYV